VNDIKIVKDKNNINFQIKIGDKYVTVATLQPWILSKHLHKYSLYFYYYGEEFEKGTYAREHINGNVSITLWMQKDEYWDEFIERVKKVVFKKLYVIGNSILEEIKFTEQ